MAVFPSPAASQTLTRADFDEDTFRRLIAQKGLDLIWEQAAECPCVGTSADINLDLSAIGAEEVSEGTASVSCPVCKGHGIFYHSPQAIQAIITGAEDDFIIAQYGGIRDGVINITVNPEHLPCFGDRFRMTNAVMLYRETVKVSASATLALRFAITERVVNLSSGEQTLQVIYAHKADLATGLGVVGGQLVQGVDFNVVDGQIEWINKPATNTRVSFTYFVNPTYLVISYPNSIRDTKILKRRPTEKDLSLPVRVQAKLEFIRAGE